MIKVFPDNGASICLAGTQHIKNLNLSPADLIPCNKQVTAVGGSKITSIGWLPMTFEIGSHSTKQPLYICEKVDRIYLGRRSCSELTILPPSFQYPMPNYMINESVHTATHIETSEIPRKPRNLPYPATDNNVDRLQQYLIDSFKSTAFNKCSPLPAMETKQVHIHLKPDAKPHAQHVPIPVPFHWKSDVKNDLHIDIERDITKPVPIGTPVQWCSRILVTAKKNGKPRRVVDFQKLNTQCLRETHHCTFLFQAAPANIKKTVFDAVDGYHSVKLDEESQPLTAFISEWGRYMYLRLPQGNLAACDAYTRRFDELISELPGKILIVDDCLLHDDNMGQSFFQSWDFLTICAKKMVIIIMGVKYKQ